MRYNLDIQNFFNIMLKVQNIEQFYITAPSILPQVLKHHKAEFSKLYKNYKIFKFELRWKKESSWPETYNIQTHNIRYSDKVYLSRKK